VHKAARQTVLGGTLPTPALPLSARYGVPWLLHSDFSCDGPGSAAEHAPAILAPSLLSFRAAEGATAYAANTEPPRE
jgi:hypothetical protein